MNPSQFTQAKADEIVRRLSEGETLTAICRDEHMPAKRTVSDWRKAHPKFGAAFLQARDDGYDEIADECLRIADTPMPGTIQKRELLGVLEREDADGKKVAVVLPDAEMVVTEERVEDMLGHRKLQIETRLKLLSKWDPRRYGDRLALANDREDPITGLTDEQVEARLAKLMNKGKGDGHDAD